MFFYYQFIINAIILLCPVTRIFIMRYIIDVSLGVARLINFFFLIFYFETFLCVTENNTKHEVLLDKKKTNGTCLPREK